MLIKWKNTGLWELMPVILATQEAEIRRIKVQSNPRQIVHETLSQKTLHKKNGKTQVILYLNSNFLKCKH
jgi:hypothetical protein